MKPTAALSTVVIGLSLGVALLAQTAHANSWPSVASDIPPTGGGEKDAAVLIGVSDYAFLPKIQGASDNATDWFRYLVKTRGVPQERVRMLRDIDATAESITEAAEEAAKNVQPGGTVWFLFIGHGSPAPSHDDGLLLGADTQISEKSLVARGVPQKTILALLDKGAQAHAIVMFDACFSGTVGDGKTPLVPGSQATIPVRRIDAAQQGRTVVLSASDQVAGPLPGHDRPAFSYLMLGALRGWADTNKDKSVTVTEAFEYVREVLRTMVRGRSQVPSLRGNPEAFVLATGTSEAGPDLVDLQAAIAPAGDIFRGAALTVPTIDTGSFSNTALREMNMLAEKALESALDNQESTTTTGTAKRDSWCALAGITDKNPYLEQAKAACDQWKAYVDAETQLEANMTNDYGVLVEYVELRRRTMEMKVAAVDSFLSAYGKYADRQEVLAAKQARDNLVAGKPAGIALDTDGDRLLIDGCPGEAEDYDGDHDDDGCPEQSAVETAGKAVESAGLHFYLLDFGWFTINSGLGLTLGVYDQAGVPAKFDQPTFRPNLGWVNRGTWGPFEAHIDGKWDLTRDLEDGSLYLAAGAGVRVLSIGPWTPSVGVDAANLFDLAGGRRGGLGVYFGNQLQVFPGASAMVTYRYGLDAPGGLVPVHALMLNFYLNLANPKESPLLELLDDMDLCD